MESPAQTVFYPNELVTPSLKNTLLPKEHGREISLYEFHKVRATGKNLHYPNILLQTKDALILPVRERTMSLKQDTIYQTENGTKCFHVPDQLPTPTPELDRLIEEPVFFFCYNSENYFHFLYDAIPNLHAYLGLAKENKLKLLMQYPPGKTKFCAFVYELLELLGIAKHDILILDPNTVYDTVYVTTSYTHDHDSTLPPRKEIWDIYARIVAKAREIAGDGIRNPDKVYISRRTWVHNQLDNIGTNYTTRRKLMNEDELVSVLQENGFHEVFAETMTTVEKVLLFSEATHIVGAIGGGIANVVFSKPTCRLTAIVSPHFLEVNDRFRYCLERTRVEYFTHTSLYTDEPNTSNFTKYMRVKLDDGRLGEITDIHTQTLTVQCTDGTNVGWTADQTYTECVVAFDQVVKLDEGLNSPYLVDISRLQHVCAVPPLHVVIPMSGIGKRFVDAGYVDPKPLICVADKPMIAHIVEMLRHPDIPTKFTFLCNPLHLETTNMRAVLMSVCPTGVVRCVANTNMVGRGPVHAVMNVEGLPYVADDEEVLVSYCDFGVRWDFPGFLKAVHERHFAGAIPYYTGFHPHMLGTDHYAYMDASGDTLVAIHEKEPTKANKLDELASCGLYYFANGALFKKYCAELLAMGESVAIRGEYYMSLVYNLMVRDGLDVGLYEIEKMYQWGTPRDFEDHKNWVVYFRDVATWSELAKNIGPIHTPDTLLLLPMAGMGSRFTKDTHGHFDAPKPLLKVGSNGPPMFIEAVNQLPPTSAKHFIIRREHEEAFGVSSMIHQAYPDDEIEITLLDRTTEGQACTCAIPFERAPDVSMMNRPILISACDNGVMYNAQKYQALVADPTIDVIVWGFRNHESSTRSPNMYAWLDFEKNSNLLRKVYCKHFPWEGEDPRDHVAIIGTMFFRRGAYFYETHQECVARGIKTNGEYYVDDVLNVCIERGLKVVVFETEYYVCWGTPNDYRTYHYWREVF